jgi:anti-sigma regulatory factor (Ser/Thr protein kinase)
MDALLLPALLDSLAAIRRYVEVAAAAAGLEPRPTYSLKLAVDEIATNIIVHGFEEHGLRGDVTIRAELNDDLAVILEDSGPPFDPRSRDLPDADDLEVPLEDRDIGGLGLYLAFHGVDDFKYERRGDRNLNTFIMRRRAHGSGPIT